MADLVPLTIPDPVMPDPEEVARILELARTGGIQILTVEEETVLRSAMRSGRGLGDPGDHDANLADHLDDETQARLAQQVIEWVQYDEESRRDWQEREAKGIRMMGLSEETEGGAKFPGASKAVHPLLVEACVQFQARAISELWPASGPVNTTIAGIRSPEREAQAERVHQYMNYQYVHDMPGAFDEEDRLLFRLPMSGSCFVKVCLDATTGKVVRRFVPPEDFVVPYRATDLESAPRYTHIIREPVSDIRRKQHLGIYRQIGLGPANEERGDSLGEVKDEIDATEGREDVGNTNDDRHTNYEMHVYLDLTGFEDKDESGEETGIALPYIVTVNRDQQKVLAVRRNWAQEDPLKKKLMYFVHRKFMPGLGFYGYGFLHLIGGLSRAATGALRALLDTALFANVQGGWRAKGVNIPDGDALIRPGEWPEVEATFEELKKAFFTPDFKEPSVALFNLFSSLGEIGQRLATIPDSVVGDAPTNSPVGTTLALIEQAAKVFSAVHKRQHEGYKREFAIVARLNAMYGPDVYEYEVDGEAMQTKRADFDSRIDVLPVSDPNIVTSTQRIAQAQSVLELSGTAPDLYDRRAVHQRMLEAMRVPNIKDLLLDQSEVPRQGPVEENMALTQTMPVRAYIEQDHQAHLIVHQGWFMGLPAEQQEIVQAAYQAHVAEHMAMAYRLQIEQMMGGQMPQIPPGQEIPPEIENEIARQVALRVQAAISSQPAVDPEAEALARENEAAQAEQGRKDAIAAHEQGRKDAVAAAEIARKMAVTEAELQMKGMKAGADMARAMASGGGNRDGSRG